VRIILRPFSAGPEFVLFELVETRDAV